MFLRCILIVVVFATTLACNDTRTRLGLPASGTGGNSTARLDSSVDTMAWEADGSERLPTTGGSGAGGTIAQGGTTMISTGGQGGSLTVVDGSFKPTSEDSGFLEVKSSLGGTDGSVSQSLDTGINTGDTSTPAPEPTYVKPRVIVSTDGNVDDRSSMVRFLMYASDYDVPGIVQGVSRYSNTSHNNEKWIEKEIELYAETLAHLKKHNPSYPDPSKLSAAVMVGNEKLFDLYVPPDKASTKETAGSKLMVDTLLDKDSRPVHFAMWGGANTLASAFYAISTTQPPEALREAVDKAWIYCTWYQDIGGQWIEDNLPKAKIYEAFKWDNIWDYQSLTGPNPPEVRETMTSSWLSANVKTNHGVLGAHMLQEYVSEGDTPSFLPLIHNGLNQHIDYTWGGWGGRPIYDKLPDSNHMTDGTDDENAHKPYWRWIIQAQQDFAGRMDWAVADDFSKANHNPVAKVVGALKRTVAAGTTVQLDGTGTTDPDNNQLTFKWWQYYDADTAVAKVEIVNANTPKASFVVPDEPGKNLHILLEVTDDGTPPMTHWQRMVFTIHWQSMVFSN